MTEKVDHPQHYNMGGPKEADGTAKFECIKVIEDWNLGFCYGNALKYILRSPHKGTEIEDLKKAIWYLRRDSDGNIGDAENSFLPEDVSAAWELPDLLEKAVASIFLRDAKLAAIRLEEHVEARLWSEV